MYKKHTSTFKFLHPFLQWKEHHTWSYSNIVAKQVISMESLNGYSQDFFVYGLILVKVLLIMASLIVLVQLQWAVSMMDVAVGWLI